MLLSRLACLIGSKLLHVFVITTCPFPVFVFVRGLQAVSRARRQMEFSQEKLWFILSAM